MLLFSPPPPTRYDLRFTFIGIPVRVHPWFWVMTALLGASTGSLIGLLIWIPAVFASILIHELGHGLAMRRFGQSPQIVLQIGGGLTTAEPVWWGSRSATVALTPGQEVFISLAGPGAGFLLAALVMAIVVAAGGSIIITALLGVIPLPAAFLPVGGGIANLILMTFLWINVFWGLINLMPVFPLDGGNIARTLLLRSDPWNGVRMSLRISVATGAVVAAAGLIFLGSPFIALLFGFLAFQSYQLLQGGPGRGF